MPAMLFPRSPSHPCRCRGRTMNHCPASTPTLYDSSQPKFSPPDACFCRAQASIQLPTCLAAANYRPTYRRRPTMHPSNHLPASLLC